ncbi:hypothetical protein BCR42DRAFT_418495 [Absidia repens]|uniref:Uncharacterized protein n=1 Tax=Absidia repens TaxID=90262 RepID=A0A1X2IC61_9FUNG|nr:hypothetical protein BCR42DRAFT_418495 [Absidia repens]
MPPSNQSKSQCPLCSSTIEEYLINLETKMTMCGNVKCTYPFNTADPTQFVVRTEGGGNTQKGKKRAKISLDKTQKSVNGKKQETTYSLTSPIEQKDKPLVLALPSKSISAGSVLTSPQTPNSTTSPYDQEATPSKRFRSQPATATSQAVVPSKATEATTMTTAQTATTTNYSLADIELLLNDTDEDNGSTVVTPKEDATSAMSPMMWLDDMFQGQDHNDLGSKCNPLQTNQDLDTLLGLSLFQ